jgi:hypothetical protein
LIFSWSQKNEPAFVTDLVGWWGKVIPTRMDSQVFNNATRSCYWRGTHFEWNAVFPWIACFFSRCNDNSKRFQGETPPDVSVWRPHRIRRHPNPNSGCRDDSHFPSLNPLVGWIKLYPHTRNRSFVQSLKARARVVREARKHRTAACPGVLS